VPSRLFVSMLSVGGAAHIPGWRFALSSSMPINTELDRLARLIQSEREGLLSRWRRQVRALPPRQSAVAGVTA